jgi:hypothetical protein
MLDRTADDAQLFHFVMIKPIHYDDDGYPIQWVRSAIPSNTLTCLNGLAEDARGWQVLGPGVDIRLHTYDETNRRVRPDRIRRDRRHGRRIENPFVFYPRCLREILVKAWGYGAVWWRARRMMKEVLSAPDRWTYTDLAIAPPRADEFETLDLYHATSGGEAALARKRRDDAIRAGAEAAHRQHAAAGA